MVFPIEILPWVALGSSLFHAAISLVVFFLAQFLLNHHVPWTALLLPIVLLPLLLATLGAGWLLAAIGVYLRDVGQITGMFTTVMLFISAVFFPISALPEGYQLWLQLNPLALMIEEGRKVLVFGLLPDWYVWIQLLLLSVLIAWFGFIIFQKTRKGFADVL